MQTKPALIDIADQKAVMEQIAKISVEKAEAAIQAVLEQYTCELVFDQVFRNGQMIQCALKCAFIQGEEVSLGEQNGD